MNKSKVLNLRRLHLLDFFGKNRILLAMTVLIVVGLFIGILAFKNSNSAITLAESMFNGFLKNRTEQSFFSIFLSSASQYLLLIVILFICGTSLFGILTVPLFMVLVGFLCGLITAFIYSEYLLKGIAFNAIILIPTLIVFLIAMLLASRESLGFSMVVSKLTLPKSIPLNLFYDFKNYCARYIMICLLAILAALIDSIVSCSFIKFFDF